MTTLAHALASLTAARSVTLSQPRPEDGRRLWEGAERVMGGVGG